MYLVSSNEMNDFTWKWKEFCLYRETENMSKKTINQDTHRL